MSRHCDRRGLYVNVAWSALLFLAVLLCTLAFASPAWLVVGETDALRYRMSEIRLGLLGACRTRLREGATCGRWGSSVFGIPHNLWQVAVFCCAGAVMIGWVTWMCSVLGVLQHTLHQRVRVMVGIVVLLLVLCASVFGMALLETNPAQNPEMGPAAPCVGASVFNTGSCSLGPGFALFVLGLALLLVAMATAHQVQDAKVYGTGSKDHHHLAFTGADLPLSGYAGTLKTTLPTSKGLLLPSCAPPSRLKHHSHLV
eukprot:m.269987 g.269987  ORF g.269987 m.269987 type:complete len:256 (+) comp19307_c4_seq1:83-850(+)